MKMRSNCLGQCGLVFALVLLCLLPNMVQAFVLIGGPANINPVLASNGRLVAAGGGANIPGANFVDPLGNPVPVKQFFRWNYPELTYAYDSTFVRYFGHNGMAAVSNAVRVLNDYFAPEDERYTNGVSSMDLIYEYDKLFSTWEFNPTANLGNVTDMQSMVLGLLVNHLGLGNPHRYCFTLQDVIGYLNPNVAGGPVGTFHVTMRNYDPYTYQATHEINGVKHGYWLWHDGPLQANNIPADWDAMEYAVGSDDEYSAIAGIRDVINFGGLAWPGPAPTVFRTPGVFFAPDNPVDDPLPRGAEVLGVNRDQPRHTLTFDDAGGLRYLYRTNNIVVETLDASVTLVTPADMNPPTQGSSGAVPPNSPFLTPQRRTITGLTMSNITPTSPAGGTTRPQPTVIIRQALRGGINKMQFVYTAYDSLLGTDYSPYTSVWTDVFITNALPTDTVPANPPYFSQIVQRTTTGPDIIFGANDLGVQGNVIPVISLPDTTGWAPLVAPNSQGGFTASLLGPGTILPPAANASIQYIFTTRAPFYQVIWAGEVGLEGNMITQFQWGWITNTGPADFVTFPEIDITQAEAITGPAGAVPEITALSVIDGGSQDYKAFPFTINRTLDTVFIYGRRTDSTTAIEVLDDQAGTTVLESINPRAYIMSDQLIKLPPGVFGRDAEGPNRFIRLVNAIGEGPATSLGDINPGVPLITSTQYDGLPLNTRKSLVIMGSGFMTSPSAGNAVVNTIEFYDDENATFYDSNASTPVLGALVDDGSWTVTDTQIIIPADFISGKNATAAALFGDFNSTANTVIRSTAMNVDPTLAGFPRQIKLRRSDGIRSNARANAHKFSHIGVGGDRNSTGRTWPEIISVETAGHFPPPPVVLADANRTWVRSENLDVLIIRGYGLDLAFSIEFVDGSGNLIESTDLNGLPPQPISLRNGIEPSVFVLGVSVARDPTLPPGPAGSGLDGYVLTIAPMDFGMNGNPVFDSIAGNNLDPSRRVVIRTPFGTAIAPPSEWLWITN